MKKKKWMIRVRTIVISLRLSARSVRVWWLLMTSIYMRPSASSNLVQSRLRTSLAPSMSVNLRAISKTSRKNLPIILSVVSTLDLPLITQVSSILDIKPSTMQILALTKSDKIGCQHFLKMERISQVDTEIQIHFKLH